MSENVFTPKLQTGSTPPEAPSVTNSKSSHEPEDKLSVGLLQAVQILVVVFTFLLPIFFLPGLWGSLGFQKGLLALGVMTMTAAILSLLMLRKSLVQTVLPLPLLWFLGFIGVASVSAIFSDSPTTAFRGDLLETGTVGFFVLIAGVMVLPLVLQQSKKYVMLSLQAVLVSAVLVLGYAVTRLIFGPIMAFESFGSVTTSPVGAFNDLAVFAGLSIIFSLIALLQLPLKMTLQLLLFLVTLISLLVLAVVNFFFVWLVTGFFGLLLLLYVISRDRLFDVAEPDAITKPTKISPLLLIGTVLVCLASAWFIVLGDEANQQVSRFIDVPYLEVRPSFSATTDIARGVYGENLLLGTGPNQFTTGWRQYKDVGINQTIFWGTNFVAGSSYMTTIAVTTGVLGFGLLALFHAWYAWFGFRLLVLSNRPDRFWYFAGAVSFAGAAFLWLMSYLYVPGATILLLAGLLTGVSFASAPTLLPHSVRTIALVSNRRRGFGLMAVAILLISGSVGTLFTVGQQYMAHAAFNQVQATVTDMVAIDQAALVAFGQYPDDAFLGVRARIALIEMNQLLTTLLTAEEPNEVQQEQFLAVSGRALALANQAIVQAPQNPEHQAVLAAIYNNLVIAGVPDALERSDAALATAISLDPKNPSYHVIEAQMATRRGDVERARTALGTALQMKQNYTEALFLLAQIDIAAGDTQAAIASTMAIIRLEPNNPTRYYQLGILQASAGNLVEAQRAFDAALELDPSHANARYSRALLFAEAGDVEVALRELRIVQVDNQENEPLLRLIQQLETGTVPESIVVDGVDVPVSEPVPQTANETVTAPTAPDSNLLTPLNTPRSEIEAVSDPEALLDSDQVPELAEEELPNQAIPE